MAIKELVYGQYEDDKEPIAKLKLVTIIIEQFFENTNLKIIPEEALAPKDKGHA
jgi:hypothetical protein